MASDVTFCARMAPQLGMTSIERGRQGQATGEWRVNALSGLKAIFSGGLVSFAMRPVGEATVQDYQRLSTACGQSKKGILCKVDGPGVLIVSTGKGKAETEARSGERAEVELRGTTVYCRDPSAIKPSETRESRKS